MSYGPNYRPMNPGNHTSRQPYQFSDSRREREEKREREKERLANELTRLINDADEKIEMLVKSGELINSKNGLLQSVKQMNRQLNNKDKDAEITYEVHTFKKKADYKDGKIQTDILKGTLKISENVINKLKSGEEITFLPNDQNNGGSIKLIDTDYQLKTHAHKKSEFIDPNDYDNEIYLKPPPKISFLNQVNNKFKGFKFNLFNTSGVQSNGNQKLPLAKQIIDDVDPFVVFQIESELNQLNKLINVEGDITEDNKEKIAKLYKDVNTSLEMSNRLYNRVKQYNGDNKTIENAYNTEKTKFYDSVAYRNSDEYKSSINIIEQLNLIENKLNKSIDTTLPEYFVLEKIYNFWHDTAGAQSKGDQILPKAKDIIDQSNSKGGKKRRRTKSKILKKRRQTKKQSIKQKQSKK